MLKQNTMEPNLSCADNKKDISKDKNLSTLDEIKFCRKQYKSRADSASGKTFARGY